MTIINTNSIICLLLRQLYGRGGRESLSMRKVRATKKQGAGEIPVKVTLRKVQQKTTAVKVRMKRCGKSAPPLRQRKGLV